MTFGWPFWQTSANFITQWEQAIKIDEPYRPVWPYDYIIFQFLVIYLHKWKSAQWHTKVVKIEKSMPNKLFKNCRKLWRFCKSGNISPNLVTLIPTDLESRKWTKNLLLLSINSLGRRYLEIICQLCHKVTTYTEERRFESRLLCKPFWGHKYVSRWPKGPTTCFWCFKTFFRKSGKSRFPLNWYKKNRP